MQIKNERPPIWAQAKKAFDFDEKVTVFTYGDTIYNPAGGKVTDDIVAHETIHQIQQMKMNIWGRWGAWLWWRKFLRDPRFRFEQELEAYQYQYKYVVRQLKDRNRLNKYLIGLAYALSGNMYGNVCGFTEAMRRIKQ